MVFKQLFFIAAGFSLRLHRRDAGAPLTLTLSPHGGRGDKEENLFMPP